LTKVSDRSFIGRLVESTTSSVLLAPAKLFSAHSVKVMQVNSFDANRLF